MEIAIVKNKEKKSFKQCIREHLQAGADITRLEAYKLYGSLKLPARIAELRQSGLPIEGDMEEYDGKRYKRYYMEAE